MLFMNIYSTYTNYMELYSSIQKMEKANKTMIHGNESNWTRKYWCTILLYQDKNHETTQEEQVIFYTLLPSVTRDELWRTRDENIPNYGKDANEKPRNDERDLVERQNRTQTTIPVEDGIYLL